MTMTQASVKAQDAHTSKKQGHWLVLAASILWGTTGTAQAFAPPGTQPPVVGAVRMLIGGLCMLLIALKKDAFHATEVPWPKKALCFAAGGVALYQLFFFAAVAKTGVAVGTIVTMGSAPIFAGILGFFIRGERPERAWFFATFLATAGCGILVAAGSRIEVDVVGILLALGASAGYAVYSVYSKVLLAGHTSLAVTAAICSLAALFLLPVLFVGDLHWLLQLRGVAVMLHLGLFATALPYLFFARGLLRVPVATAVTLTLAEPLAAGLLGVVLLAERLTLSAMIGVALIFSGLLLLARGRR